MEKLKFPESGDFVKIFCAADFLDPCVEGSPSVHVVGKWDPPKKSSTPIGPSYKENRFAKQVSLFFQKPQWICLLHGCLRIVSHTIAHEKMQSMRKQMNQMNTICC